MYFNSTRITVQRVMCARSKFANKGSTRKNFCWKREIFIFSMSKTWPKHSLGTVSSDFVVRKLSNRRNFCLRPFQQCRKNLDLATITRCTVRTFGPQKGERCFKSKFDEKILMNFRQIRQSFLTSIFARIRCS